MDFRDAVPNFQRFFPETREIVVASDVASFLANRPSKLQEVALFIWDEMVGRGLAKTPKEIGPYLGKSSVFELLKRKLRRPPFTDAFSAEYYNAVSSDEPFAEVSLVQCFPNDIHIVDVKFENNNEPLPPDASSKLHEYRGLHVFGEFLANLLEIASQRKIERLSLIAATRPLYEHFSKYGFTLSEAPGGPLALQFGEGIPMVRKL